MALQPYYMNQMPSDSKSFESLANIKDSLVSSSDMEGSDMEELPFWEIPMTVPEQENKFSD